MSDSVPVAEMIAGMPVAGTDFLSNFSIKKYDGILLMNIT